MRRVICFACALGHVILGDMLRKRRDYIRQEALERHFLYCGRADVVEDHVPVIEGMIECGTVEVGRWWGGSCIVRMREVHLVGAGSGC